MPPGLCHWKGTIISIDGVEYALGDYHYDSKTETVYITELPFQKWNTPYLHSAKSGMANKDFVLDVDDQSTDTDIDIRIMLKPGAMLDIMDKYNGKLFDPVIECFKLKLKMNSFMNFIGPNHSTLHFTKYQDMLKPWFAERKRLYGIRIRRQSVIVQLKIQYYENLIRFIDGYDELNVSTGFHEEEADKFLEENKFDRFNKVLMGNPEFTPIDDIIAMVTTGDGASYEYIKSAHNPNKRSPKACKLNHDTLAKLRKLFDELANPAMIVRTWIAELVEYDTAYNIGITDGWVKKKNQRRGKGKVVGGK
jgi:DNA gyrase/topoisomerase IV subunit A